jgi:hypothetical protein
MKYTHTLAVTLGAALLLTGCTPTPKIRALEYPAKRRTIFPPV